MEKIDVVHKKLLSVNQTYFLAEIRIIWEPIMVSLGQEGGKKQNVLTDDWIKDSGFKPSL